MLSVDECKKILGDQTVASADVEVLRDALYEAAQLAFDAFWLEKVGSKNPLWLLPLDAEEGSVK